MASAGTVWTLGHWTCEPSAVLSTLDSAGIEQLVDVRTLPGSRRSPQFDAEEMQRWLGAAGIDYLHLTELGGRRPRQKDVDPALNAGWRSTSFKNYADYTLTAPFEEGLARLTALASTRSTVIMCGEPLPWRCHRLLIANALVARGRDVVHLQTQARPMPHELGRWGARPVVGDDGTVTYPEQTGQNP